MSAPPRKEYPKVAPDGLWNPFDGKDASMPSPCPPSPAIWEKISKRREEVVSFLKHADKSDPNVKTFLDYYPELDK